MRFQTWYPANQGEKRISKWFAFFPVKIGTELRWFETVHVEWEYKPVATFLPPCTPRLKWVPIRFVEESQGSDVR